MPSQLLRVALSGSMPLRATTRCRRAAHKPLQCLPLGEVEPVASFLGCWVVELLSCCRALHPAPVALCSSVPIALLHTVPSCYVLSLSCSHVLRLLASVGCRGLRCVALCHRELPHVVVELLTSRYIACCLER